MQWRSFRCGDGRLAAGVSISLAQQEVVTTTTKILLALKQSKQIITNNMNE